MASLYKTMQRSPIDKLKKKILGGQKNYDKVHFIGKSLEDYNDSMKPPTPAADKVIPMPDEEELTRQARRKNSGRAGGRASTVLSEDDRLGP